MGNYTTTDLVASEIRASAAFSSSTVPSINDVTNWITEISAQIDLMTNATFGSTVVSSELNDYNALSNVFSFPVEHLLSIDKVEYNVNSRGLTPSWVTLSEGADQNYITYLDYNELQFVAGENATYILMPQNGPQVLRLSYTYGFSSTPLEVQHLATLMVAKRVIQTLIHYQTNTKMGEIAVGPIRVADPTQYSLNYVKQIDAEIAQLRSDIGFDFKTFKFTRVYDDSGRVQNQRYW